MTDKIRRPGEVSELAEPVKQSRKKTEYQQKKDGSIDPSLNRKAGVINQEAELLVEKQSDTDAQNLAFTMEKAKSPFTVLLFVSAFLFLIWTIYDLSIIIIDVYASYLWLGLAFTLLGVLFVSSLIWLVVHEYQGWKSFDSLTHRQSVIDTALRNDDLKLIKDTLSDTLKNIKKVNPALVAEFEDASFVNNSPEEYLKQLDNIVLLPLDRQAENITKKISVAAGLSVFIVPHPALDAIAVTWHGFLLSKKIANIYGVEVYGLSSLRLFKYILSNAVIAAGTEVAREAITDVAGDNAIENVGEVIFGNIFSKMGEGAVTVWRIYRLGRIIRLTVRPKN